MLVAKYIPIKQFQRAP